MRELLIIIHGITDFLYGILSIVLQVLSSQYILIVVPVLLLAGTLLDIYFKEKEGRGNHENN